MKTPRQSLNHISGWQAERINKLQRVLLRIKTAVDAGKPIEKTIRRVALSLDGLPFRCDSSRYLKLSPKTLRRVWDAWRRGGEVPSAIRLKFKTPRRIVTAAPVERFINFALDREFGSFAEARRAFNQRKGSAGPGLVRGKPLVLGYDTLLRNLPPGFAGAMRACHRATREARRKLGQTRLAALAYVQAHAPAKLEKPTKANNYQI